MAVLSQLFRRLAGLDRAETPSDADLADLGLTRTDYQTLTSAPPGARRRLVAMATRMGLTEADIDHQRGVALDAAETCARCGYAKACQHGLDTATPLPVALCPNAKLYAELSVK